MIPASDIPDGGLTYIIRSPSDIRQAYQDGLGFDHSNSHWCDDPEKRRLTYMKAREFDKKFDEGGNISKYLDMSKARRPEQEQKRVNVDFPLWMIQLLDKEARRLGVPRQSIIKVWVAERLEKA
jgi:hypothetical protein